MFNCFLYELYIVFFFMFFLLIFQKEKLRDWFQLLADKVAEAAYSDTSTFNRRTQIEQLHGDDPM